MNYFFENQTKQNPGRSKSCECLSSKSQLLPLSVGTLKTKYRGFYKGFRRLSKRAEIFFFKEEHGTCGTYRSRVQTIVDERIQAIAKKILKKRYTVHQYTGQLAVLVVNQLIRLWTYFSLLLNWKADPIGIRDKRRLPRSTSRISDVPEPSERTVTRIGVSPKFDKIFCTTGDLMLSAIIWGSDHLVMRPIIIFVKVNFPRVNTFDPSSGIL